MNKMPTIGSSFLCRTLEEWRAGGEAKFNQTASSASPSPACSASSLLGLGSIGKDSSDKKVAEDQWSETKVHVKHPAWCKPPSLPAKTNCIHCRREHGDHHAYL